VENIGRYYIHIDHVTLALLGKQLGIFFFWKFIQLHLQKAHPQLQVQRKHIHTHNTHTHIEAKRESDLMGKKF